MDASKRAYKGKDTEMLLAISTIIASAICYEDVIIPNTRTGKISYLIV